MHPPGAAGPPGPPDGGRGRRRGAGLLLAGAIVAAIALAGAAVWFLVLDDSDDDGERAGGGPGGGSDTVELDGVLVSDREGVFVVSEDGADRTLIVAQDVGDVFDDGFGGLIWQADQPVGSGSAPAPTIDDPALTTIWHLPAGAREPVELTSSDDPEELRFDLRAAGRLGDRTVIVYVQGPDPARGGTDPLEHELVVRDVGSDDETVLYDGIRTVVGDDGRITYSPTAHSVSLNDEAIAYVVADRDAGEASWIVLDPSLEAVSGTCDDFDPEDPGDCPTGGKLDTELRLVDTVSNDDRTMLTGYEVGDPRGEDALRTLDVDLGDDLTDWRGDHQFDVWDGRIVHSWLPDEGSEQFPTVVTDIESGEAEELGTEGLVRFLRAPLVRPAS